MSAIQKTENVHAGGWGWLVGGLGLVVSHAAVGVLTYFWATSSSSSSAPSTPRRRPTLGGSLSSSSSSSSSSSREVLQIPIPVWWNRFDPSTTEGRHEIADRIINHETTNDISDYLFEVTRRQHARTLTLPVSAPYKRTMFEAELAMPLTTDNDLATVKPTVDTAAAAAAVHSSLLWKIVIPSIWLLLSASQQIQSRDVDD
jgi:hypothetical protein